MSDFSSKRDSLSKLRQFRLQKKTPAVSQCNIIISNSQIKTIAEKCQSLSAGKDQGVYLVPDYPETEIKESIKENFEANEKNEYLTEGPQSLLQVIFNDESTKSKEKENSVLLSCDQIKKENENESERYEESESALPIPLNQIKKEPDFDESRTEEMEQTLPISYSDIKKELDIEIEENGGDDDDDDDNNNSNDDNNNSNNKPIKRKRRRIYCDGLKERERSLKLIMEKFPYADIMEMQDILLFAEWNVQQAIAFIQEHPSPLSIYGRNSFHRELIKCKKQCKGNDSVNNKSEEDSDELTSDGWLAKANKETLKTYSKNISERKVVHPSTKPVVFYGSKERARIKKEVENFILNQSNKQKLIKYNSQDNSEINDSIKEIQIKIEN